MKNSIINVNDYILGKKYNRNTIINDINTSIDLLFNNSNNVLLNELRNNLSFYLSRKADDCINFINFIENNNYDNPIVYNLYEKYNLPFINSKDPRVDQYLLSKLFKIDNLELAHAIYYLCCFKDRSYISKISLKETLHNYLGSDMIDFQYFGVNPMLGHVDSFEESEEDIADNMENLRSRANTKNHNSVVAHYAELVVYEYLKDNIGNKQDLKWVSRDIGDGFGYDLAVVNEDNSASLYEVKGLYNRDYADISDHEHNLINYSSKHDDLDYHIMVVLTKDNDTIVDIHKDINNNTVYDIIGKRNYDIEYNESDWKVLVKKK